jgi:hypothetical protein
MMRVLSPQRDSDMTCRFLDGFSFAKLLAPMAPEEFARDFWQDRILVVRRENPGYYDDLFGLEDFDAALASAPSYVKAADGKAGRNERIEEPSTTRAQERLLQSMRGGATLILDQLHRRDTKLGLLCRLLEQELGHRFQTNLYLTPPNGQGFSPHFDEHDVFVLQTVGSKDWRIDRKRRTMPLKGEKSPPGGLALDEDGDRFTLHQGDLLYIPRGFVHAAECGPEPSLHITLGLIAQTWHDLLQAALVASARADEGLLRALPFGFLRGGRDGLAEGARAALERMTDGAFLAGVVDRFCDELVATFPLDLSGQVAAFYRSPSLDEGTAVGPRSGIVYRLHAEGDAVRLQFGGRTITFPGFLRTPLEYALRTPDYAIRDIAGDLEPGEKVVFVERLLQEGLVVVRGSRVA